MSYLKKSEIMDNFKFFGRFCKKMLTVGHIGTYRARAHSVTPQIVSVLLCALALTQRQTLSFKSLPRFLENLKFVCVFWLII